MEAWASQSLLSVVGSRGEDEVARRDARGKGFPVGRAGAGVDPEPGSDAFDGILAVKVGM